MTSNRNIDNLIINGEWRIDTEYGMAQLMQYLDELDMLERGVPIEELGISKRKEASLPELFSPSASGYQLLADSGISSLSSARKTPRNSFAILKLSGVMRSEDGWCSYGMYTMADWIAQINANDNIAGILIRANSGGGESLSGQILKNALIDSRKPVVTHADFLGSAAVEGTLPSAEIIASGASSRIGSIGVYASIDKRMREYYQKNYEDIYATQSPQKNIAFREYLRGNIAPLQKEIDKSATSFQNEVLKFRPDVAKYADTLQGGVFDAKSAKKRGLVDSIGTFNDALRRLAFHAGVKI